MSKIFPAISEIARVFDCDSETWVLPTVKALTLHAYESTMLTNQHKHNTNAKHKFFVGLCWDKPRILSQKPATAHRNHAIQNEGFEQRTR